MGQSDERWSEVGEQLETLGSLFKANYQAQEAEDGGVVVSDDEVKDALRTLGDSVMAAFATVGDAFTDIEIRDEARKTAASFLDALGATFSKVGDDISRGREKEQPSGPTVSDGTGVNETPEVVE